MALVRIYHSDVVTIQLQDRDLLKDVLKTARNGNFQSMALTVDLAWYGNRERDIRNGFSIPPNYSAKQMFEGKEDIRYLLSILISDLHQL